MPTLPIAIALTACSVSSQSQTLTANTLPASPIQNTSNDELSSQAAVQRFRGSYVLRRVNNVPGSTPAQRKWHLYSADLKPVS